MSPESPAACPAPSKAPARLLTPRITGTKSPCKENLYSADFYELPSGLSRKLSVADLGWAALVPPGRLTHVPEWGPCVQRAGGPLPVPTPTTPHTGISLIVQIQLHPGFAEGGKAATHGSGKGRLILDFIPLKGHFDQLWSHLFRA